MGYYMRYITTDPADISILLLEEVLRAVDDQYSFRNVHTQPREFADLMHSDGLYGQIEINRPGDGLFEEELEELSEFLETAGGRSKRRVVRTLAAAKAIVAVQVLWQGRGTEATLDKIGPLWDWLFRNREGLLRADGEGYYDRRGLIIADR